MGRKDRFKVCLNHFVCCKSKKYKMFKKKEEIIFEKGYKMIQKELNAVNLLQSIQKMKAILSVIVQDDDHEKMDNIRQLYYNNASIFLKEQEEKDFIQSKNVCMNFLEEDQRYHLHLEL